MKYSHKNRSIKISICTKNSFKLDVALQACPNGAILEPLTALLVLPNRFRRADEQEFMIQRLVLR